MVHTLMPSAFLVKGGPRTSRSCLISMLQSLAPKLHSISNVWCVYKVEAARYCEWWESMSKNLILGKGKYSFGRLNYLWSVSMFEDHHIPSQLLSEFRLWLLSEFRLWTRERRVTCQISDRHWMFEDEYPKVFILEDV